MKLFESKELESIFIEIINHKQKNTIIGCIYRHPNFPISQFNETVLQPLLDKLEYENKNIVLLGDFNINLLQYETHSHVREFVDKMYSVSLIPKILAPTRLTCHTKTLIDNIFTNVQDENYLFGNLTCSISDHLLQFMTYPQNKNKSYNILPYWQKYVKLGWFSSVVDWNTILAIDQNDINLSLENFMNIIECLLNKYAPLKKMTKKQLKNLKKPWLTSGILKSVKNKNKIFNKFCKAKDPLRKRGLHQQYKHYRNQITTLTRISKEKHYKQYFETNKQNAMKL